VSKLDNKIVDYIARSYNGEQYIIKKTKMLAHNKEHQHTILKSQYTISKSQHTISKPTHTINKKIIKSLVSKMRIYKNRLLKRACENPNKNIFENIKNKKQKKSKTKQLHLDRINKSLSGDLYNIFHQSEVELFGSDTNSDIYSDTYSDIYSDTESEAYYYNDLDYCYFSEQRFMRVYYA
jgi:maltooligosyltrehalose synthase